MPHYRTPQSIKAYNWFKLASTLTLMGLFVFLLLRVQGEAASSPLATPTTVVTVQTSSAPQTPKPTPTAPASITPEVEVEEDALPIPAEAPVMAAPQVSTEGTVTFSGTGMPDSLVEVWAGDMRVGQAFVGADGAWTLAVQLDAGDYDFTARAVDVSGATLAASPSFQFSVPAPQQPPTLTTPQSGALIAGNTVMLAGTGTPGAQIEILDQGKVLSTTVVQSDGTWTHACSCDSGARMISVRSAGEPESASEVVAIQVAVVPISHSDDVVCNEDEDNIPLGANHGTVYVVAPCEYIGLIATRVGVKLADLLAANPQLVDPDRIEPGQILNLPPR